MDQGAEVATQPQVQNRRPLGEFAGHFSLKFTEVADFGLPFRAILAGAEIPPGGAGIDVRFAGSISGGPLAGEVTGTDHLDFRVGLRSVLRHVHLAISTKGGGRIAAAGEGTVVPTTTVALGNFRIALLLRSSAPEAAWAAFSRRRSVTR